MNQTTKEYAELISKMQNQISNLESKFKLAIEIANTLVEMGRPLPDSVSRDNWFQALDDLDAIEN